MPADSTDACPRCDDTTDVVFVIVKLPAGTDVYFKGEDFMTTLQVDTAGVAARCKICDIDYNLRRQ
jgi:hypothetical protein